MSESADSPEDFSICSTFWSTPDEVHFYRTQAMIEYHCTRAMPPMKSIIPTMNSSYLGPVSVHLDRVANIVDELTEILAKDRADCDPAVFYNQIRVRFTGRNLVYGLEDRLGEDEVFTLRSRTETTQREPGLGVQRG